MIGDEGPGSLYEALHRDGLIDSLSAGPSRMGANNWMFHIALQLTEKGLAQRSAIVERLFAALAGWAAAPLPAHLAEEHNTMAAVRYRFQSRGNVFDAVVRAVRADGGFCCHTTVETSSSCSVHAFLDTARTATARGAAGDVPNADVATAARG